MQSPSKKGGEIMLNRLAASAVLVSSQATRRFSNTKDVLHPIVQTQVDRLKKNGETQEFRLDHVKKTLNEVVAAKNCEDTLRVIADFAYHKPHQDTAVIISKAMFFAHTMPKSE